MLPILKSYGNIIIAICGTKGSYLAENAAIFLDTTVEKEACPNNLAPTTSTTAQMVMGDALAVTLLSLNQFNEKDFARVHPGGALGKQLYLTVKDLCQYTLKPQILPQDNLKTIIHSITEGRVGATAVVDNEGALLGIITDGDLRRALSESRLNDAITAADIMTPHPKTVEAERLAADALQAMRANDINQIVVMEYAKYVGMVHLHDILREGIV